ncbi:MAG: alpha/beta fold hydrolase [Planctomycetota bacterium]
MPPTLEQWKLAAFSYMGETLSQRDAQRDPTNRSPIRVDDTRGLEPVQFTGAKRPSKANPIGRAVIGEIWGNPAERHGIDPEKATKIQRKRDMGEAAPVEIQRDGCAMRGNFYTAKGHNLADNNFAADTSRPVVLLLTGSGGSAQDQGLDMAEFYSENGASVMSVNYSGFGDSDDREPNERSLYEDAQAMLDHLVKMGYDAENIIIHGYSMGGPVAAALEQKNENNGVRFRGAVLDRPMSHATDAISSSINESGSTNVGTKAIGFLGGRLAGKFKTEDRVKKLDKGTRKLVTADTDNLGPFAQAMRQQMEDDGHLVVGADPANDGAHGHEDHQGVIADNEDAFKELIGRNRHGGAESTMGADEVTTDYLMDAANELDRLQQQITQDADNAQQNVNGNDDRMFGMIYATLGNIDKDLNKFRYNVEVIDEVLDCGVLDTNAFQSQRGQWRSSKRIFEQAIPTLVQQRRRVEDGLLDEIEDALDDAVRLGALFAAPSENDPLGTKPAGRGVLASMIEDARQRRATDYEFDANISPSIVASERREVLEIVRDMAYQTA